MLASLLGRRSPTAAKGSVALAKAAITGSAYSNLIDKKKSKIGIGSVSDTSVGTLFVPGSIWYAPEAAKIFSDLWLSKMKEGVAWINSNMPLSDYPEQMLGLRSAKKRNEMVEEGIIQFIKASPNENIEIIAHSAGSGQALRAVRKYKESGGDKAIRLFLIGAGAPGVSIDSEIEYVTRLGVEVCNIVDERDLVPSLAGSKKQMVCFRGDGDIRRRSQAILDIARAAVADVGSTVKAMFVRAAAAVVDASDAHAMSNYLDILAEKVTESRAKTFGKSLSAEGFSAADAEEVKPISHYSRRSASVDGHSGSGPKKQR